MAQKRMEGMLQLAKTITTTLGVEDHSTVIKSDAYQSLTASPAKVGLADGVPQGHPTARHTHAHSVRTTPKLGIWGFLVGLTGSFRVTVSGFQVDHRG